MKKEIQEATANLANANEISLNAAVAAVLSKWNAFSYLRKNKERH